MRELLRIQHARGDRNAGSGLKDYNMEISQGEILYIQGSDGSGIREIADILSGDLPLFEGQICIEEESMDCYSRKKAYEKHVFPICSDRSMIYNLTVAENMEAIWSRPVFWKLYSAKKVERRVNDFLGREGVRIMADSPGSLLCTEEEVLLSILKAKLHGAALVILELLNSAFEGNHAEEISSLMTSLCNEGMSFIILSSSYSCFAAIATRIQLVYRGRDLKEWRGLSGEVIDLLKSQSPDSFAGIGRTAEQERGGEKGTFLGMYDYEWENDRSIWDFLKEVRLRNASFWERNLNVPLPEEGISMYQDVLVIPKESGTLWFENLSIEDNLLMPIPNKIAGCQYGIIPRNRREHVVNRFHDAFHVEKGRKEVRELSKVQRKLFSIYRYELLHPKTIFLENPYWGMDQEEITQIRNYLAELQGRGIRIVCCAKSIDEMKEDCASVIQTDNAGNARVMRI